jgi:hypothetical protein
MTNVVEISPEFKRDIKPLAKNIIPSKNLLTIYCQRLQKILIWVFLMEPVCLKYVWPTRAKVRAKVADSGFYITIWKKQILE